MPGSVAFPEYRAIDPSRGTGSLVGNAYWFLKSKVLYGPVTYPYGVLKHERLLATCDRTQSHTYTCFVRTPSQLEALAGPVLDFLGAKSLSAESLGRPLEILVLACSNGAEAYTLASFLTKRLPDLDFHITAADLHQEMVDSARAGSYSEDEALQSQYVRPAFVMHTFDKVGDRYVVKPELKARTGSSPSSSRPERSTKRAECTRRSIGGATTGAASPIPRSGAIALAATAPSFSNTRAEPRA